MRLNLILLICLVVAGVGGFLLKFDEIFGDEDPVRRSSRGEAGPVPGLPDVRQEKVPIDVALNAPRYGMHRNLNKAVVGALKALIIDGAMEPPKVSVFGRQKKMPLDVLVAVKDASPVTIEEVEALGESGAVDKALLGTVARDKMVPLEAIKALAEQGRFPAAMIGPLEIIAEAGLLPTDDLHVKGDALLIETVKLTADGRPIQGMTVTGQNGDSIQIDWDEKMGRWTIPSRSGAPATQDRMKIVCRALDGMGTAEFRGARRQRHSLYELEGETGARVQLTDEQGETVVDLRIGKQDNPGNVPGGRPARPGGCFVREFGGDRVYRHPHSLVTLAQARSNIWVDLRFMDIDYETINSMVAKLKKVVLEYDDSEVGLTPPNMKNPRVWTDKRVRYVIECETVNVLDESGSDTGPIAAVPAQDGDTARKWKYVEPEGIDSSELNTVMVDSLSRLILNGRKEDVEGTDVDNESYGLDKPIIDMALTFEDGRSYQLKVGAQVPIEGELPEHQVRSRYAHLSGDPFVMKISEHQCRALMKRPEDFTDPAKRSQDDQRLAPGTVAPPRPVILDPDEAKKKAEGDKKKAEGDKKKTGKDKKDGQPDQVKSGTSDGDA